MLITHFIRSCFKTLILFCFVLISTSCAGSGGGGGGNDNVGDDGGGTGVTAFFATSATSDSSGLAIAEFDIPIGTDKFAIVSTSDDAPGLATDTVVDHTGTTYLSPRGEITTTSSFAAPGASTVNIPSRDFDPNVSGGTFSASVFTLALVSNSGIPIPGRSVTMTIMAKSDEDTRSGDLVVNVFYVGPLAGSAPVRSIVNKAIDEMRDIFSSAGSIDINVTERDIAGPAILPDPLFGSSLYSSASASAASPALNIFVGLDVDIGIGGSLVLGIAGGIPGPAIPTAKSAVAISFTNHAGPDGEFSDQEITILGETMAHESGHFMGLFHPVESTFDQFDPLTDTAECRSTAACTDAGMIENMMYFSAAIDEDGKVVSQSELTSQQRGVLNLYIAVD